jgi:hypothetical protein
VAKEKFQLVGTSKSKEENAYYIQSKEKFWGLIEKSKIGKRYEPSEFNQFTKDTGVGFCELVFNKIVPKDKDLKQDLELVQAGVADFVNYLESANKPEIIAFNGKTAAGWFFEYIDNKTVTNKPGKYLKNIAPDFNFGKFNRNYNGVEIYILPNTSGVAAKYWQEAPWLEFWNKIATK